MNSTISVFRMEQLFDIDRLSICIEDYDTVLLSLNSILNSMYYPEMEMELSFDNEARTMFEDTVNELVKTKFLDLFKLDKVYHIYMSNAPSSFKKYIPDWDKVTNEMKYESMFFRKLTNSVLKVFFNASKQMKNIKFILTGDKESALYPFHYIKNNSNKKILIMSRDIMDLLNVRDGIHLYDGMTLFKSTVDHCSKKIPKLHWSLLPYYLFLVGNKKHSYKGIKGYGAKTTVKFLTNNSNNLKNNPLFDTPEFKCFDFEKYYIEYKEELFKQFQIKDS